MPFLSFIVGFRNRDTERVSLFLESLKAISSNDFELIFVDYGSDVEVSESVRQIVSNYSFAKYHFFDSRGQNWNRSKCLNYGYTHCKGEYVFTSDIDFLYSKDFVSIIKEIVTPTQAFYFKVGFLSQKQSQHIHFNSEKYDIESYSNEEAVGALLISRKMFEEVGGYDEFYEIWGVEDNDLLYRIKMTGNKIDFYHTKTILWHIWHLPVKQSSVLPNGWLKYLKDYFEHKKQIISKPDQNFYCMHDPSRPILNKTDTISFKSIVINCSEKYLPLLLKIEMDMLNPNDGLILNFNFSTIDSVQMSGLNKLVKRVNKFFNSFKSPVHIENRNMDLYLSKDKAIDALQYFIKSNKSQIRDFYIPSDINSEPVYLMKN